MKIKVEDIELIESYKEGTLSQEQRVEMEKRLEHDESFRRLYNDLSTLIKGIKSQSSKEVLAHLKKVSSDLPTIRLEEEQGTSSKNYLKLAAVVSLLIVASGIFFFLLKSPDITTNAVFEEYHEYYPNQITQSVRGSNTKKTPREEAYEAYEFQDFEKAITLLKEIPVASDDGASIFYLGLSHLEKNEPDQAIEYFRLYLSNYKIYQNQATWYLGLSLLKIGDKQNAIEALSSIASTSSYFSRAQQLIKVLRQGELIE